MSDRATLIARKQELRRKIERLQRELTHAQSGTDGRKVGRLQAELEQLTAQEYTLRLAIDRSR